MSYASIMVHMVVGAPNEAVLRVAAGLAERMKAGVIGIAASAPTPIVYQECYVDEGAIQADLETLEKGTDEAEAQFRAAMTVTGGAVAWRSMIQDLPLSDYVARQACAADVVVTGAETGWFAPNAARRLIAGDLVLILGRPVLVVSASAEEADLRKVVVAWKDTREARRAIVDALPLLKRADRVSVVEIRKEDGAAAFPDHLADVVAWLRSHGVGADAVSTTSTGDDAAQLRAFSQDRGAGLVVAGAYGHTRLREWVFGGVTRDLLLQPERCSLVSH